MPLNNIYSFVQKSFGTNHQTYISHVRNKMHHTQATLEADAQRGNERAEGAEKKITDIEEELRFIPV